MSRPRSIIKVAAKPRPSVPPIISLVLAPAGQGRWLVTTCRGGVPQSTESLSPFEVGPRVQQFITEHRESSVQPVGVEVRAS